MVSPVIGSPQGLFIFASMACCLMKGVTFMSCIKFWLEEHIDELSNEELMVDWGFSQEEIDFMRECFKSETES